MPENSEQTVWAIARSSAFLTAGFIVVWATLKLVKIQSPRVHRICWLVVLAQGLVFFTLQIEVPLYSADAERTSDQRNEISRKTTRPFKEFSQSIASNRIDSEQLATIVNVPKESDQTSISQMTIVFWLAGIAITLATQTVNYFRFVSGVPKDLGTNGDWQDQWSDVCATAGIRRKIELIVTHEHGPALCWTSAGYRLLIPQHHWNNLSVVQRELILRHELAHYQRGDLWLGLLFHSLASLHWFNPFAWLAVRRLAESAEWSCDAEASGAATGNCTEYVEALLEFSLPRQRTPTVVPNATGHSVVRRAQRLLTPNFTEDSAMKKLTTTLMVATLTIVNGVTFDLVAQENTNVPDKSPSDVSVKTDEKEPAESAEKPSEQAEKSADNPESNASSSPSKQLDSAEATNGSVYLLGNELIPGIPPRGYDFRLVTEDAGSMIAVPAKLQFHANLAKPIDAEPKSATREAVIDIRYIFQNLPEFERLRKSLEEDLQIDDQRMRIERKSLLRLAERLKRTTDANEREELETELTGRQARMNAEIATARRRLKADEARMYAAIYTKVREAIADHAKSHGIQIVRRATTGREQQKKLESGDPQAIIQAMNAQVLYIADDSIDITDAVLERLKNVASKSSGK